MSVASIKSKATQLLADAGRAALHANYPDDFEYYSIAFELIDHEDKTIDLLVFPVLPSNLTINEQPNTNIKRTGGGVAVLFNTSFQPFSISMSGNFGRKFRFLVGQNEVLGVSFRFNFRSQGEFDSQIKTGYGTTKVLDRILKSSLRTDDNQRPFKLLFHNMAFNQSHVVEVLNSSFSQNDSQNNMIWQYSISLRAIAPSVFIRGEEQSKTSLKTLLKSSVLQNALNAALSEGLSELHDARSRLLNR